MLPSLPMRRAAVAGSWYPPARIPLEAAVDAHLARAGHVEAPSPISAIIAPHAALPYSGPVAAFAYEPLTGPYRAAILVGPSHFVAFEGVSIWPSGAWDTPCGPVEIDEGLAAALMRASSVIVPFRNAHAREHSLEMQLPFLVRRLPGVPIVPLLVGHQTRRTADALAAALAAVLQPEAPGLDGAARVLLIASSDLSHYEDARTAGALDRQVIDCVEALDAARLMDLLEREPRHACGGVPMVAVLQAATMLGATRASVLEYADSGDVSGDKSSVVGYLAAAMG